MRRNHARLALLILGVLISVPALFAQTLTTVSGHVQTPSGTAAKTSYVLFELRYCGANQVRVIGTTTIPQATLKVKPASSGAFTTSLYGNDQITCGSTLGGTRWRVTYFTGSEASPGYEYLVQGATFDLDTATPLSVAPVVAAPTGDDTYVRLDTGNTSAMILKFPNAIINWASPGAIGATAPNTGAFTSVNGVFKAETFAGADASAKLTACIAAVTSAGGGTCDARGFGNSAQSISATVQVPSNVTVEFDPATLYRPTTDAVTMFAPMTDSVIRGITVDLSQRLTYTGTIFAFGDNYRDGNHTLVENVKIKGQGVTGGIGFDLVSTGSSQAIDFVTIKHVRVWGIGTLLHLRATGAGWVNGNHFYDVVTSNSVMCLEFDSAGGDVEGNEFIGLQCQSGANTQRGLYAHISSGSYRLRNNKIAPFIAWDFAAGTIPVEFGAGVILNTVEGMWNNGTIDTDNANSYSNSIQNMSGMRRVTDWLLTPLRVVDGDLTESDVFQIGGTPYRRGISWGRDPDGSFIFYGHSWQNNDEWQFTDLNGNAVRARISMTNGNAIFSGGVDANNAGITKAGAISGVTSFDGPTATQIFAACTGVVGTSNATAYPLFPGSSATACTGSVNEVYMATACTARKLYVRASAAGAVAGSGVVEIYKNNSASGVKCTLGTSTSCTDTTNTIAFAAGDSWSVRVTTGQASDTTANVRASFLCY